MTRTPLLLAACAALVVAGCTSGKDPGPNYSTVSAIASATQSPTPTERTSGPETTANVPSGAVSPTEPTQARQNSSDGAFAFVAYYWRQVDWAYSTVNPDALVPLYRSSCKSCESSRAAIDGVRQRDHTFKGGHVLIQSQKLATPDADPSASFAVDTALTVQALTEVGSDGSAIHTYPASAYTVRAFVAWSVPRFQVVATANVGSGK